MPTAYSILPERFEDGRHKAIEAGLAAAGFRVERSQGPAREPADVLVAWTVHHNGASGHVARQFERSGHRVIVCEEGHLPPVGGEKLFSLSLGDHQKGPWHHGGPSRWASLCLAVPRCASLCLELKPWRDDRGIVLVRQQRGIGSAQLASPPMWAERAAEQLRRLTKRPVKIRGHPKVTSVLPLEQALRECWCLVTWASAEGTRALLAGVPVIWCAPFGFAADACGRRLEDIAAPPRPDRLPTFERIAWSQWRLREIATGAPFRTLPPASA